MVRDLMTNCQHLNFFLVVQKILPSLKLTTVFTVTTEGISQNCSEKKFQLQPDIIIIAHSQNQTSFFFSEETETVSFFLIWPRYHEKSFSKKLTRRNADGQNVHHQRVTQSVQAVHPCERCRPTLPLLSCLPLSVHKQNFSSVVAALGFL